MENSTVAVTSSYISQKVFTPVILTHTLSLRLSLTHTHIHKLKSPEKTGWGYK